MNFLQSLMQQFRPDKMAPSGLQGYQPVQGEAIPNVEKFFAEQNQIPMAGDYGGDEPLNSNIMQQVEAPQADLQPEQRQGRSRSSLLDTIGGIADVFARVGGAEALYQPMLDAREDRGFAQEDRMRSIDMDAMRKQQMQQQITQGGQQIAGGEMEIANAERAQLGQALGVIASNPDATSMWPQIAEQAGIDPQRAAQIGQLIQSNPQMAGALAQSLGWQPAKQGSQSKELQVYGLLQEQDPELAQTYLQSIANPGSMTPYQQAQLQIAMGKFEQGKYEYETNRGDKITAAGAKAGAASGSDVAARNRSIYNALDAVETSLAPLEQGGWTGAIGGYVPGILDSESDIFDTNIADLRQSIRGITKLKGDQITEYEAKQIERMLPSRTQTPEGRRQAIKNIRSRIDEIVSADTPRKEPAAVAPARRQGRKIVPQYKAGSSATPAQGGNSAAMAEARRRGLI